jgi:hypothetical protein
MKPRSISSIPFPCKYSVKALVEVYRNMIKYKFYYISVMIKYILPTIQSS